MNLPEPIPSRVVTAHRRHHGRQPIATCWHCQRAYAMCLSKITYDTREAGAAVALEINLRDGLGNPVVQYPCDWGSKERPHWHIAHATKRIQRKRARRQHTLWVRAQEAAS